MEVSASRRRGVRARGQFLRFSKHSAGKLSEAGNAWGAAPRVPYLGVTLGHCCLRILACVIVWGRPLLQIAGRAADPGSSLRTSRRLLNEIGREPTPGEIAEKLHMPVARVRLVLKIAKEPLSLATPIGDEDESQLGDFIEDKEAVLPVDAAIQSNLREATTRALASLNPREERIVRMRFGIGMTADHTLAEVGQQFSVSRERIRQIEAKALRKLKHPHRSRILRSFIDN